MKPPSFSTGELMACVGAHQLEDGRSVFVGTGLPMIATMLAQRDRRVAGMTAPAHGLVLWKVFYGKKPSAAAKSP